LLGEPPRVDKVGVLNRRNARLIGDQRRDVVSSRYGGRRKNGKTKCQENVCSHPNLPKGLTIHANAMHSRGKTLTLRLSVAKRMAPLRERTSQNFD
jgi:hypothetical protein